MSKPKKTNPSDDSLDNEFHQFNPGTKVDIIAYHSVEEIGRSADRRQYWMSGYEVCDLGHEMCLAAGKEKGGFNARQFDDNFKKQQGIAVVPSNRIEGAVRKIPFTEIRLHDPKTSVTFEELNKLPKPDDSVRSKGVSAPNLRKDPVMVFRGGTND